MKTVELHDAESDLAGLVGRAAEGEAFVIAREGRPLVTVVPVRAPAPSATRRRIGFLKGRISVPDAFDTMWGEEIIRMFEGDGGSSATRISRSGRPATRASGPGPRAPSSRIPTPPPSSAS